MTDRIDVLVTARNQTSGALNQVKQELSGLDGFASKLNAGLSGIGAIAGIGAVVAGLQQIGAAIDEVARRGAIFEQLGDVLDSYAASAGQVGKAFVEAGRNASAGTIGDYDLILNANRALQFEVASTSDQYAKLIELATALGRAQGISDTQSLEFLTTGIARESKMILDNLGLIIDLDGATSAYAGTIGKTAGELTTAERKQAILNEAFRQGATAIEANRAASDSAATNFERMDASIQNAKDNLGALFAPAVAAVAKSIADATVLATDAMREYNQAQAAGQAQGSANNERLLSEGAERIRADLQRQRDESGIDAFSKRIELAGELRRQEDLLTQATAQQVAALKESGDPGGAGEEIGRRKDQLEISRAQGASTEELARQQEALNRVTEVYFQLLREAYPSQATTESPISATAEAALRAQPAMDAYEAALRRGEAQSQRTGDALGDLYAALENASPATKRLAHEMLESGYSVDEVTGKVNALRGELSLLQSAGAGTKAAIVRAAAGVAGIVGDAVALELAKQKTGELDFALASLEQREKDGTISKMELAYETAKLNDEFTGTFDAITEADRAAKSFAREGLSAAKKAANEAEQAFESLKGKVAGVLQEALNVDVGVDPNTLLKTGVKVEDGKQPKPEDFLLPRADAINEEARRLADIAVKGFESPWLEYFKTAWPDLYEEMFAHAGDNDSVRKTAALLLQNFEDGLNPELIDKDKAKDRIKRMLLGETRMEELAQEIASELSAEFGGSISLGKIQATANSALGVDGGSQVQLAQSLTGAATEASGQAAVIGGNIRSGIVSALDGIGETVAIALDKQLRAENNLKITNEAGRAHGEAWGSGFLATVRDGVPSALVEILASLVGPQLEAVQARNATLNGAN